MICWVKEGFEIEHQSPYVFKIIKPCAGEQVLNHIANGSFHAKQVALGASKEIHY